MVAVCWCCRLYKVHEEDGKPFELEMSWLCEESGWKHARVSCSCCCLVLSCTRIAVKVVDRIDCDIVVAGLALPCLGVATMTEGCGVCCRCQLMCKQMRNLRQRQRRRSQTWRIDTIRLLRDDLVIHPNCNTVHCRVHLIAEFLTVASQTYCFL